MKLDISFRLAAAVGTIPADHGYLLYAALSRKLPYLHESLSIAVHPIRGRLAGERRMALCDFSRVVVRADVEEIRHLMPLSGARIDVGGTTLNLGVPELQTLNPITELRSRIVVIKLPANVVQVEPGAKRDPVPVAAFEHSVRKQLATLDATPSEIVIGDRRTMSVKGQTIVGYEVCLSGLSPEASVRLQEQGLGGRHLMGAGVFAACDVAQWKSRRATRSEVAHG